jgi:hypothetical protein
LQLTRPRSVGVEAAGLAAIGWLGIDQILADLGFNLNPAIRVAGAVESPAAYGHERKSPPDFSSPAG